VIDFPLDRLPISKAKYPYSVRLLICWPPCVQYRNQTYDCTGKEGIDQRSGLPSAEYSHRTESQDQRVWLRIDGAINPD
jgi:hypothetical protein